MPDFALNPKATALINVDMQRCFVEASPLASPAGLDLASRVNRLSASCREAGITVVHTRGWLYRDGSNTGNMADILPAFIRDFITEGNPTAEIHDAVVVDEEDWIVDKPRYGAFTRTDLESRLRSHGIDTVIVTGIATNICCETTAREASQLDFHVFFLSDGTATRDMNGESADDLQRTACANVGQVFGQIATVDEMIAKIERATRRATPAAAGAVRY